MGRARGCEWGRGPGRVQRLPDLPLEALVRRYSERLHRSCRRNGGCLAGREKSEAKQADDKFDDQNGNTARQVAVITIL